MQNVPALILETNEFRFIRSNLSHSFIAGLLASLTNASFSVLFHLLGEVGKWLILVQGHRTLEE